MRVLSFSEKGCVRKNNEDGFLALPEEGLYAVADGMGGHQAGEVASSTALLELQKGLPGLAGLAGAALEHSLREVFIQVNQVVYESSQAEPAYAGMGTTLTAMLVREGKAAIAHVGDSRIYLWREEVLTPLTVDHSLVEELVRLEQISPAEAETHPQRHVLMRAVGTEKEIDVDCRSVQVQAGDVFLLCTDGFSNLVSAAELGQVFQSPDTWGNRLETLRLLILERGAPDNFTALCCIVE